MGSSTKGAFSSVNNGMEGSSWVQDPLVICVTLKFVISNTLLCGLEIVVGRQPNH